MQNIDMVPTLSIYCIICRVRLEAGFQQVPLILFRISKMSQSYFETSVITNQWRKATSILL